MLVDGGVYGTRHMLVDGGVYGTRHVLVDGGVIILLRNIKSLVWEG